ncbi:MAG: TIGR01212 family radical SAM protein [SAR324 cluster bacterium]|nr:TIGR01212 family radical SAM protein [SAR324 cluster bacterium]
MEPIKVVSPWGELPYYSIGKYYQKKFGIKIRKLSVQISETCPVRQGNKELCIFCDEKGAGGDQIIYGKSVKEQIDLNASRIKPTTYEQSFLAYFQTYTSTFGRLEPLERALEEAISCDGVKGVVISTRPDCLPSGIFPLLKKLAEKTFVSVEVGAQSFNEDYVAWLKRGHTAQKSIDAIKRLSEEAGVDVGAHIILGLPNQTLAQVKEEVDIVNSLPLGNIKLHHLYVLKDSPLAAAWESGEFKVVEFDDYVQQAALFLANLNPSIAVQRLSAFAKGSDGLLAPDWTKERSRPGQEIMNYMAKSNHIQGSLFKLE